ncbi:hypothetical protein SISSUDRAFT_1066788 [Sistotremastrum suecicum HHB10207 ss-3]|uniref:Uncharacterized protein n=1 Tax=Sistotremastrum suecicum HHB10207 ss-3 TaxID=1314776 RepID=A0A165XWF5_9AGAM|nr:hypothetical protein SISSUDRAFT_1066788 [Sistotremastrum suecicum HHB10207 ss-3]
MESLRPSLAKMLSCAPIVNAGWRSASELFRPSFWESRSQTSFAVAVDEYIQDFSISHGERIMLRELASQADRLETLIDEDTVLLHEIYHPQPNHPMYPLAPGRLLWNLFMNCILLDRFLWSIEQSCLPLIDQWHRPGSLTQRASWFRAYEDLPSTMDTFLIDLGAVRSYSSENHRDTAPTTLSHASATFFENFANHMSRANLETASGHFMYWCATALVGIKGFDPKEYSATMAIIKNRAPSALRLKMDRLLKSPNFRNLMSFWSVVAHSPLLLFSPKFFEISSVEQKSTVAEWMQHVGFCHQYPSKLIQLEHSIFAALRQMLGNAYETVDAHQQACREDQVSNFLTKHHLIFQPVQLAAQLCHHSNTEVVCANKIPWPFHGPPPLKHSLPLVDHAPSTPTSPMRRLGSSPEPDRFRSTYVQYAQEESAAIESGSLVRGRPSKRKRSYSCKKKSPTVARDKAKTPIIPLRNLPMYIYEAKFERERQARHRIISWNVFEGKPIRFLDEFTIDISKSSVTDYRDLQCILETTTASDTQNALLAPKYILPRYTRADSYDTIAPLSAVVKILAPIAPLEDYPELTPEICLARGINVYVESELYQHSQRSATHSTTIAAFVSVPLIHRRSMCLKNLPVSLEWLSVPEIVRDMSCLSFALPAVGTRPFDFGAFVFTSIYSENAFDRLASSPAGLATWIRSSYGAVLIATLTDTVDQYPCITPTDTFRYEDQDWRYDIVRQGDTYLLPPGTMYCLYALTDSIVQGGYFDTLDNLTRSFQSEIIDHIRQLPVSRLGMKPYSSRKRGRRRRRPTSSPDPTPTPPPPPLPCTNSVVRGFEPETMENNEDVDLQAMSLAQDCAVQSDSTDVSQSDSVVFPDHTRGCVVHSKNTHHIPIIPSPHQPGLVPPKPSVRDFLHPRYIVPSHPWAPFVPALLLFDQPLFVTLRPLQTWPTESSIRGTCLEGSLVTSWKLLEDLFQTMSDAFLTHLRSNAALFPLFGDCAFITPPKPSLFGYQNTHREGYQTQTQATLANVAFHIWIGYLTFFFHLFGPNDQACVEPLWYRLLSSVEPSILAQLRETMVFRPRLVEFYLSFRLPVYYYWDEELSSRIRSPDPPPLLFALEPPESRVPRQEALSRQEQSSHFDRYRYVRDRMYHVDVLGPTEANSSKDRLRRYENDGGCTCFTASKVFEWLSLTPDGPPVLCREIHEDQRESIFNLYHPRHRFYDPRADRWDLCLASTNANTLSAAIRRHVLPEHNFVTDLRSIIDKLPATSLGEFHPVSQWDTEMGRNLTKAIRPWATPPPYSIFPASRCSIPNTDAQFVSILIKRYGLASGSYPNTDPDLIAWNQNKTLLGFDWVKERSPEVQDYRTPFGFVCVMEKPDPPKDSPFTSYG